MYVIKKHNEPAEKQSLKKTLKHELYVLINCITKSIISFSFSF